MNRLAVIERVLGPYIDKVDKINTSVAILLERSEFRHIIVEKKVEDGKSVQ